MRQSSAPDTTQQHWTDPENISSKYDDIYNPNIEQESNENNSLDHPSIDNTEPDPFMNSVDTNTSYSSRLRKQPTPNYYLMDNLNKFIESNSAETRRDLRLAHQIPIPKNCIQALKSKEKEDWRTAIDTEIRNLDEKGTFEYVHGPIPENIKPIRSKAVFRVKPDQDGYIDKFKVRLVARGFEQVPYKDFDPKQTFAPVARARTIRTFLSIANKMSYHIHSMDIVAAYLNSHLKSNIYMTIPQGFLQDGKPHVVKIVRGLYGLVQAGALWNNTLNSHLIKMGFERLDSDPCIYIKNRSTKSPGFIAIYVDDILIATHNMNEMMNIKSQLQTQYNTNDLGPLTSFLGMKAKHNRLKRTLHLSLPNHTKEIIDMFESKISANVPMTNSALQKTELIDGNMKDKPYMKAVGKLIFLCGQTRPDITYAVHKCARFMANPSEQHWNALERIANYLYNKTDFGITFGNYNIDNNGIVIYCDSDYGGDKERRSTTGYLIFINGDLVSWDSRLQKTVALSTTEAEYMALAEACKEALWFKNFLYEINSDIHDKIITIYQDNKSAIEISQHPIYHNKTKHINIRHHFVRDLVETGSIEIKYTPTTDMLADIMTKPLSKNLFNNIFPKMRINQCNES